MSHANVELIDRFFAAYGARDLEALSQVLAANCRWAFPGRNPFSGTHAGLEAVVAFFDAMGGVMGQASVQAAQLVSGEGDEYVVQAQHVRTNRPQGRNLDHYWCVLWRFADGKIVEGRHLASDQYAVDEFFNEVTVT